MPFTHLKLHPTLLRGIKELGFTRPTPIQEQAIPPALQGRDVLATSMTGSGKTAAFLLPIAHRLMDRPRGASRALVLTPTRELAAQIVADMNDLAVHTPITAAAVYGGVGMGPQEHAFRSGVDVIVATPGRLLDHFRYSYAKMNSLECLVLDEVDRMLDMGFIQDIRRVLRHLPHKRQTLFFSATMPGPIDSLAREMLRDPVTIALQRTAAPAAGITQALYPVPQHLKTALLTRLFNDGVLHRALVFVRTKSRADRVARSLDRAGVRAESMHSDRSQKQRTLALAGFHKGRFHALVATDIAARGIDVEALGHVVNYDVPKVAEDYIHRVGRTGRAELRGEAFTFVSPDEEKDVRTIERALGKRLPRVTQPDFDYSAREPQPTSHGPARARPSHTGRPEQRGGARVSENRRGASAPATPRRPASPDRHGGSQAPSRRSVRVAPAAPSATPAYGRGRGSGPRRPAKPGKRR